MFCFNSRRYPVSIADVPTFVRGGYVVPRRDRPRRSTAAMAGDPLTLVVAPDANGDAVGEVYWPSLTTSAQLQWLPARVCGEAVTNGGVDPLDVPVQLFPGMGLKGAPYAYGQGERTICYNVDEVKKQAGNAVMFMVISRVERC